MAFFDIPLADQARMIRSIETGVRSRVGNPKRLSGARGTSEAGAEPRLLDPITDFFRRCHADAVCKKSYAMGIDIKICLAHRIAVMSTAEDIKAFREARGWSQSDLASRLGVDQATVSRIERGTPMARPVALLMDRLMAEPAESAA